MNSTTLSLKVFLAVYHKKEKNTILTRLCKQGQQLAKCIWLELKLYDILDDCQGALNHHMFIRIFPLPFALCKL